MRRRAAALAAAGGLLAGTAAAEPRLDWGHGPWGPGVLWGAVGVGAMLLAVVLWALLIVGAVVLVRWLLRAGRPSRPGEAAEGILKNRCARGEIGREEFEERRRDLRG